MSQDARRNEIEMNVKILRSEKRKRTISARLRGEELFIYLPSGLSESEEKRWIEKMRKRVEKKMQKKLDGSVLSKRARELNQKYFDGKLKINSVEYSTNQNSIFGSCATKQGTIRISHRVAEMPTWVIDYLIIHELAHLVHPNHSKDFWNLVNHYKYAERARGYLIARGMEKYKGES